MRRRWERLLIPLVALVLTASAGAGLAAAEGPYPPVPSDAELQQLANDTVARFPTCGTTIPNGPAAPLHVSCTDIQVSKWHSETSAAQNNDNWVLVTFKISTGVFPDGRTDVNYHILSAQITDNAPLDLLAMGWPAGRRTNDWSDWIPSFLTPGWDVTTHQPWSPSPSASPELPLCSATISVSGGLKAGDTLAPDATVTSMGGASVQGTISMVWTINGAVTNSVAWDGNPATIVLQLSCQGHAQEFHATYNGTLTQGPAPVPGESSAPEPSGLPEPSAAPAPEESGAPAPSGAPTDGVSGRGTRAATPGLGGIGDVPGPADPLQGLLGMLVPGLLGVLGGLLLGGTGAPVAPGTPTTPGGPAPSGGEPGGGPGSAEGTQSGGAEGTKPGEPSPGMGDAATQVAITKLAGAMNRAAALKNPAMMEAISQAQAEAFDADGKVIPEKMAAAWQIIRGVAGSRPGQLDPDAEMSWAVTDALKSGLGAIPTAIGMAGGAVVSIVKGAGNLGVAAVKGVGQIGDAVWNYKMFGKGLDAEMKGFVKGAAGAEVKEANDALRDGRYLDMLGAQTKGIGKVIGAMGGKAWGVVREILPADEVESFTDPNASLEQKLWAVPAAAVKIAGMLLGTEAGLKPVPGISRNTTFIPSALPGARAAEAAAAAGREAASATGAARQAAEHMQASAAAAAKVERLAADALGGKAAPASLREASQILNRNPELRAAVDRAILADAGSGSVRALRQEGALSADAHTLITAGKVDQQSLAMSNAGRRIAQEETAGWIKANTDPATGLVDYSQAPRRIITSEATEGNRAFASGAHAGSDLDRTHYLNYVSGERANQILNEECVNLGFDQKTLATNAYVAKPGTLMDTSASAAAPNNEAWLRRNMGQVNSQAGYVPTYVSKDGVITTGAQVGGSRGAEALPMGQRFGAPTRLTSAEAASSVAHQLEGLKSAVAPNNISDGVKFAARAITDGAGFDGSAEAIMRAAMTKDPAMQVEILRQAGINSVAELLARVRP